MATSGTYTWDLDNASLVEEAYEIAGFEARTAHDAITARRSLNLIFRDWSNWGVNLWTLEQVTTSMVTDTASYTLTNRTLDVLSAVMRDTSVTPNLDYPMDRLSIEEYHNLPDKTVSSLPNQFALVRGASAPTLYVYPAPDASTYDFVAWQIRYIQDAGAAIDNPEVPQRFYPALIYRLAYEIMLKKRVNANDPEVLKVESAEFRARRQEVGARAQQLFDKAREEDSTAASMFIRPRLR